MKHCTKCGKENDSNSSWCKQCKRDYYNNIYCNSSFFDSKDFKRFGKTIYYINRNGEVLHIWYSHRRKKIIEKQLKIIECNGDRKIFLSWKGTTTQHYINKLVREVWVF